MLAASTVNDGLSLLIQTKLNIADLHFIFTWYLNDSTSSIHTPRYLITFCFFTLVPLMFISAVVHLVNILLEPNIINSDLLSFIFNLLPSIQFLILSAQLSRSLIVLISSTRDLAANDFCRHGHLQSHGVLWVYLSWVIHHHHLLPLVMCWHRLNIALVQHMTLVDWEW